MSYYNAKDIFNDSLQYIDVSDDPVHHNLNVGLAHLAQALETDMTKIQRALSEIATSLQRLEQK